MHQLDDKIADQQKRLRGMKPAEVCQQEEFWNDDSMLIELPPQPIERVARAFVRREIDLCPAIPVRKFRMTKNDDIHRNHDGCKSAGQNRIGKEARDSREASLFLIPGVRLLSGCCGCGGIHWPVCARCLMSSY